MSLTRDSYALAERVKDREPDLAKSLKKSAVAVPAQVAGALEASPEKRGEHVLVARGALAELTGHARRSGVPGADELVQRARDLERSILFELGAAEVFS